MDDLQIILPVYNEVDSLETVLREWKREITRYKIKYHFIICEDGSTDGTKQLLLDLKAKFPLVINQRRIRRGYGTAVIDGIKCSTARYLLCIDSDGQCDPKDFKNFWKNKEKDKVLIGLRVNRKDSFQRKVFSALFKVVFDILFPTQIKDPSAPFVLFRKNIVIPNLRHLTYLNEGFWWGFVGMCVKAKLNIMELPMTHRKRIKGDTQVYKYNKLPDIAVRNLIGLFRLKFAK